MFVRSRTKREESSSCDDKMPGVYVENVGDFALPRQMQNPSLFPNPIVGSSSPVRSSLKRKLDAEFVLNEKPCWPFRSKEEVCVPCVTPFEDLWENDETLSSSFNDERKRCERNLQALKKAKVREDEKFYKARNEILKKELKEAGKRQREAEEKMTKMIAEISKWSKTIAARDVRIKNLEAELCEEGRSAARYKKMHLKLKLQSIKNRQIKGNVWSFIAGIGENTYPPSIQSRLNAKWRELLDQKTGTVMISLDNGKKYSIDFLSMTQKNNKTGCRRRIKMTTIKNLFDGKWTRTWECNIGNSMLEWVAYSSAIQKKLRAEYEKTFTFSAVMNERKFEVDLNEMTHRFEGMSVDVYKVVYSKCKLDCSHLPEATVPSVSGKDGLSKRPISTQSLGGRVSRCLTNLTTYLSTSSRRRAAYATKSEPLISQRAVGQPTQPSLSFSSRIQMPSIACEPLGQKMRTLTSSSSISEDGSEYGFVFGQFFLNCRNSLKKRVNITRIDAFETPKLTSQYLMMKTKIEKDLMHEGLLNEEMWVYHGTKPNFIKSIMSDGFKIGGLDVTKANGNTYGFGVYTSKTPSDPIYYASVGRDRNQRKQGMIIMARSILGKRDVHSWSPPKHKDWMVFRRSEQVLPCYVVHYEFS